MSIILYVFLTKKRFSEENSDSVWVASSRVEPFSLARKEVSPMVGYSLLSFLGRTMGTETQPCIR